MMIVSKLTKENLLKYLIVLFILLCVLIYLPAYVLYFPDGLYYFSYLPAVIKNRNYDFFPPLELFVPLAFTKNGFIVNDAPIGTSVLWTPAYLVSLLLGEGKLRIIFTNFFSSLLGIISLYIIFFTLKNKLKFSSKLSLMVCLFSLFGTPLIFYIYTIPQNPHTSAAFLCSLILSLLIISEHWHQYIKYLLLGLLFGLLCTVREQNVICGIPIFVIWLKEMITKKDFKRYLVALFFFIISFLVGLSSYLINIKILFDTFYLPKFYTIPIKYPSFFSSIYEVLFSSYHSVLLWTPLILLSMMGFIFDFRNLYSFSFLLVFIADTIIISLAVSPGGGGLSFGIRYYTDLIFIISLGIANLYKMFKSKIFRNILIFLCSLCSLWTFILFIISSNEKIDLIKVYGIEGFVSTIPVALLESIKNFNLCDLVRYDGMCFLHYVFLFLILIISLLIIRIYFLILHSKKLQVYCTLGLFFYLTIYNLNLLYAGKINRIVYKNEQYKQFMTLNDYQNFYNLLGINLRLQYYSVTKQIGKYNYYLSYKQKLKFISSMGKALAKFYNDNTKPTCLE